MFKDVMKFFKDDSAKWFFVVVIVLLIIWALMSYSNTKSQVMDNMQQGSVKPYNPVILEEGEKPASVGSSSYTAPVVQDVPSAGMKTTRGEYELQPVANPQELLPKDQNSEWAALNPVDNNTPILPDLLQAGNLIGLDTIGQTLKNANLQLRSDPIIQKQNVGPWNNSTYEADLARVPLEIGCTVPN